MYKTHFDYNEFLSISLKIQKVDVEKNFTYLEKRKKRDILHNFFFEKPALKSLTTKNDTSLKLLQNKSLR